MKNYELGDLVQVKCGLLTPMQKGSVGLIIEVMDSVQGSDCRYIVRFSERETFLYYHNELVEP